MGKGRADACGEKGEKCEKEEKEKGQANIYKNYENTMNEGGNFKILATNQGLFYSSFIF